MTNSVKRNMANEISTDSIFTNIYGPSATQETRSIMGGKRGRKSGGGKSVVIYGDVNHIPNDDFKEFIDNFHLDYYTSRAGFNTIYIIPSAATRKKMYGDLKALTKDVEHGSVEEKKIVMDNAEKLQYKRYIFSKFGDNKRDDGYKIGPNDNVADEYPNGQFSPLRRTNVANEIYYFNYLSPEKILISVNADFKKTVELKFIGRAARGMYVFEGDLPKESPEMYIPSSKNKTVVGGNRNARYMTAFKNYVNSFSSIDNAANDYVVRRYAADPDSMQEFINADRVYTMFATALSDEQNHRNFNDSLKNLSGKEVVKYEREIENISKQNLIEDKTSKIKNALAKLHNMKDFDIITHIGKIYANNNPNIIRADIMTALYRDRDTDFTDIGNLISFTNTFASGMSGGDQYSEILMSSYEKYPMTSNTGRANCFLGNYSEKLIKPKKNSSKTNTDQPQISEEQIPVNEKKPEGKYPSEEIPQIKEVVEENMSLDDFY